MPVNDTTTNRSYQKPNIANTLADDVGRLRSALDAIDTDMASKAPTAGPTFTGVTTIAAGTAAAPSLTFTGATSDTGFYSPGTDQVAISTGGTERFRVDASGRLGLGTSAPGAQLSIISDRAVNTYAFTVGTKNGASFENDVTFAFNGSTQYIGNFQNFPLAFITNNTERCRLDTSGRLLVGTSSGQGNSFLQIKGDAGSSTGVGSIFLQRGLTVATIGSSGNVDLAKIEFGNQDGAVGAVIQANADAVWSTNDYPSRLTFSTTASGASSPTERMRISSAGNVGINTNNPVDTLQVEGNIYLGTTGRVIYQGSSANLSLQTNTGSLLFLRSNGSSESARFDSSGRLLVGTSTESGGALLQVNGDRIRVGSSKTPASASATGTAGEICWDASYIYVCTATNTWKRAAIASW